MDRAVGTINVCNSCWNEACVFTLEPSTLLAMYLLRRLFLERVVQSIRRLGQHGGGGGLSRGWEVISRAVIGAE